MRYLSIIAISLLLISCSEDTPNEPVPNPVAPALTLEVLTSAPELGQPVEFKATVTGVTLAAPVYEWDFGDGKTAVGSTAQLSHTYTSIGSYCVTLRVIDTTQSLALRDTVDISVQSGDVSLTLTVMTANPEAGMPVEFKAEYTGPALAAPMYSWDFGDDTADSTGAGSIQHTYASDGSYRIVVRLLGSSVGVSASDSTEIAVAQSSPVWKEWNWVEVSIHVPARFKQTTYRNQPPSKIDSEYVSDTSFVIRTHFDPSRMENKRAWNGYHFHFIGYEGVTGGEMSAWYDQVEFDVWLSANGQTIDSIYARNDIYRKDIDLSFESKTGLRAADIPAESISSNRATYALRGSSECSNIRSIEYLYEDRDTEEVHRTVEVLLTDPDMYIEVRFDKK